MGYQIVVASEHTMTGGNTERVTAVHVLNNHAVISSFPDTNYGAIEPKSYRLVLAIQCSVVKLRDRHVSDTLHIWRNTWN